MVMHVQSQQNTSTFYTAIPYGVGAIAVGGAGLALALSSQATAAVVAGVALAIIGAYGTFAVMACAFTHSGDPEGFKENIGKFATTIIGAGMAEHLRMAVQIILIEAIQAVFRPKHY